METPGQELAPEDSAAKAQLSEVHTAMAVPSAARSAFKEARKLYHEDQWEQAIERFNNAIDSGLGKPETYMAWVMLGWCEHQLGNLDESLRDFDTAIAEDATRVLGWYSRGMAHKRLGRAHQSKEDCDHAVDLTWEDLARASLEDFGLPPLGVEEQMCDVPEGIRVFFTQLAGAVIGDEMFGMRCYEAAVAAYSLALRSTANATLVVPRDALCRWHFQRGRCFLLLRRHVEALTDFSTVISKVPENKPKVADAHFFRGHLYSQSDRWSEAEEDLKKCLQLNSQHDTAQQLLTSIQEKLSSRARSAEEAEKELLAQLDKDQEREKKKREKNKQKKQRQKEKKKKDEDAAKREASAEQSGNADSASAKSAGKKSAQPQSVASTSSAKEAEVPADGPSSSALAKEQAAQPSVAAPPVPAPEPEVEVEEADEAETEADGESGIELEQPSADAAAPHDLGRPGSNGLSKRRSGAAGGAESGRVRSENGTVRSATTKTTVSGSTWGSTEDEDTVQETDCPLCCEPFDATDLAFTPCPCGYKVCIWCYHRLKAEKDQCPACRQQYQEVQQKMVKVARKHVDGRREETDRRATAKIEEAQLRELFAATNGGLRQSELDSSVVDLLQKLEPSFCRQVMEKFRSVTSWATIRNKSGFVTAEIQKLRASVMAQSSPSQSSGNGDSRSTASASAGSSSTPGRGHGSGGSAGAAAGYSSARPETAASAAARTMPVSSPLSGPKSSWAAAVGQSSGPKAAPDRDSAEGRRYPAHELVQRLSQELEALPGGKQTRRERRRLEQRMHEAEHSAAFEAEARGIAQAADAADGGGGGGGGDDDDETDGAALAGLAAQCVLGHYTGGAASFSAPAAGSALVTLLDDDDDDDDDDGDGGGGGGGGGARGGLCARPLLHPGTLSVIVRRARDHAGCRTLLLSMAIALQRLILSALLSLSLSLALALALYDL
jgi:tetratricopeptide (TPR) repeat protein